MSRIINLLKQERGGTDDSAFEMVPYLVCGVIAISCAQNFFINTANLFLAIVLGISLFVSGSGVCYLFEKLVARIDERIFRRNGTE